jgi:hypothetical protein
VQILVVAVLLDREGNTKPSLNCNTTAGFSPLMRAAEYGRLHVMEAMFQRGAEINFRSTVDGSTAVMRAAAKGQSAAVRMLCERGANLKIKVCWPADHVTLMCGHCGFTVGWMIAAQDFKGRTAVDWAEEYKDLQQYIAAYSYGATGALVAVPGAPNPLTMCKFGCGAFLPPRLLAIHEREGCPKRPVECGFECGATVWAEELLQHQVCMCVCC